MRRAKILIISVVTIVLLVGLVLSPGCAKPAVEEEENLLIVAVFQFPTIDFFAPTRVGAEDAAEEYGVDFEWLGPATQNILEEISIIETVLAKGEVDGFVLQAGDPDELLPVVKRIKEAGIPVIVTNELVEHDLYDGFAGADGIAIGELIGKQMELNLLGEGVWAKAVGYEGTGKVEGKIAFFTPVPGSLNLETRLKGARDYLLSQFPGIIDLGIYDGTVDITKSKEAVANVVAAHPDLVGILSVGAEPTVGAGMLLEEMGLVGKIVISGMDLLPLELRLVKSKVIAAVVGQNPYGQGYLPVEALAKYLLNGTPIPKWLPTELEAVTLENVDSVIEREEGYMAGK